jgi:hypothetical protein
MISFGLLVEVGTGIGPAPAGPSDTDGGPTGIAGGFAPTAGGFATGLIDGIAGTTVGSFGIVGTACFVAPGNATRDLQLEHATNFAPTGTSVSAMRLCVPHAEQVASIIRDQSYPGPVENAW